MYLILLTCLFAAAAQAGYASPYYYGAIQQHYPVIGPGGHPVDTPEVQHAKAAHFAAHASARYGHPGIGLSHNALPADTPEVAAAKLQHYHDYAIAAQRNGVHAVAHVPHHSLGAHYPVDTPEVQIAKAAHFAAHAAARSGHHAHYRRKRELPYGYHFPVLDQNGVPTETPEVQAAKAHHFAEYNRVAARPGQNIPDTVNYNTAYSNNAYSHQPQQYSAPNYYASAPLRGPGGPPAEIGPDGQPLETPEVRAAKAAHFAAYAAVRTGQYGHYGKK